MALRRPDPLRGDDPRGVARAAAEPADAPGARGAAWRPGARPKAGAAAVRRLQAAAGNRAVSMLLREPGFQLPTPSLLGGERPRPGIGGDLRLDPDAVAKAEAEVAARLAADALLAQIRAVRLGRPPPPSGQPGDPDVISGADPRASAPLGATAPPPASGSASAPPPAPQPRPGEVGDLIDAITADPGVAAGLARVKDDALRAFRSAPPGERRVVAVSLLSLSALAVGGALATPGGREMLGRLSGTVLPVPGVDWLGLEFNTQGDDHLLGLHVDVGALLPRSWGFGPAGPGQGPMPLTSGTAPGNF